MQSMINNNTNFTANAIIIIKPTNNLNINVKDFYFKTIISINNIISNRFKVDSKGKEGINYISSNSLYVKIDGLTTLEEYKAKFAEWEEEGEPFAIEGNQWMKFAEKAYGANFLLVVYSIRYENQE